MRKSSAISMQRAMVIFAILTAIFFVQMLWWIIFQVRNSGTTKEYLLNSIENEQKLAIRIINSHYEDLYGFAQKTYSGISDSAVIQKLTDDPAVSGIQLLEGAEKPTINDSLYFIIKIANGNLLIFLNREYPGQMIAENGQLLYQPTVSGELNRPDWLDENSIVANPSIVKDLELKKSKHVRMFVMEGMFFLFLVSIGAAMIYKALKRTKEIREEQLLFVHSITHELKIPITSIGLFLDTIRRRGYETNIVADLAPKMKEDLARLNHLIDNILQVRRLSDRQVEVKKEIIDLSAELKRYGNLVAEKIEASGGKLHLNIEDGIRIEANLSDLVKVWESLIDNSLKYGPSGNLVLNINLISTKDHAELQFIDNGPGISEEIEEKLFQPFYRGNIEKGKIAPGSGLGLYIAREFIRRHKGQITIGNVPAGGCMVSIKFKRII
jgi:signal transduction histidine kinase